MRKVAFLPRGFEEFNLWAVEDKKIYAKIVSLISDPGKTMYTTVTLDIPDSIYQRLLQTAQATQQSLESVLLRVLQVGSPPDWQDVPEEFQADVAALDCLDDEALWQVARSQVSEVDLERYDQLLEIQAMGELSEAQRWELLQQRKATERFMLRKAQAVVLLRWRGYSVMDLGVPGVALHS